MKYSEMTYEWFAEGLNKYGDLFLIYPPELLGEMVKLVENGEISNRTAKEIFAEQCVDWQERVKKFYNKMNEILRVQI